MQDEPKQTHNSTPPPTLNYRPPEEGTGCRRGAELIGGAICGLIVAVLLSSGVAVGIGQQVSGRMLLAMLFIGSAISLVGGVAAARRGVFLSALLITCCLVWLAVGLCFTAVS